MDIVSTAFENNDLIPAKYTCEGQNFNPPLTFSQVPKETKSLALILDDPDAVSGTFVHWVLYNMPSSTIQILENTVPENTTVGTNDFGNTDYGGPCPPKGTGKHRYFFKLYALDIPLDVLSEGATKVEVEEAMQGHILEKAQLIGLYTKD